MPTIAASDSTKIDLEKNGFSKVSVFHQGLSATVANNVPPKPQTPIILFIGRLTRPKGPQDAIIAFKRISKSIPEAKLIIVGSGKSEFAKNLKDLVEKFKLEKQVSFTGFIPQSQKIELLKKARIVLIPSVREGWNLVPIEANSQGCVPIGYNVQGLRDSIQNEKTGVLTRPNNPQQLAQAAISLLKNKNLWRKLAKEGLAWSEKFNWDKTYQSFSEIIVKKYQNILWLSWRDIKNPDAGGAEKVSIETASRFVRDDADVTIFTSRFKKAKSEEIIKGVKIIRRGNRLTCRFWALFYYLNHRNAFDLIIDEINTIPFFSIFYAKDKTITLIHQLAREFWFSQTPWPISLIGYRLEPFALKLYKDRPTIVVSRSTENDLEKLGFEKLKIVREGLDFKPQYPNSKENLILFIGRLIEPKGPRDAITAFRKISNLIPGSKLVIIGRGDPVFTASLKLQVKDLSLKNKVKFTDFIPESEKINYLSKAKIVLIPSIREGWGLVATETNALGAVPIAYNVPGLRDSIKNRKTGILTKTNPQSLAEAAIKIMKDNLLRNRISRTGYEWSKEFSWENCYQDFRNFIEETLKSAH